jgi:hypothetical protein
LVFAGYRAELGTGSIARESSESEGSYAETMSTGPTTRIPPSSGRLQEEGSAAPDAQILVISTLIALAIVAGGSPLRNDYPSSVNVISRDSSPRSLRKDHRHRRWPVNARQHLGLICMPAAGAQGLIPDRPRPSFPVPWDTDPQVRQACSDPHDLRRREFGLELRRPKCA